MMRLLYNYRLLGSVLLIAILSNATDINEIRPPAEYECGLQNCYLCKWCGKNTIQNAKTSLLPLYRDPNAFECNICLDTYGANMKGPSLFNCDHTNFCGPCILRWVNVKNESKCPMCRANKRVNFQRAFKNVSWFAHHWIFHLMLILMTFSFMDWLVIPLQAAVYNHFLIFHFFMSLISMICVKTFIGGSGYMAVHLNNFDYMTTGINIGYLPNMPNMPLGNDPISGFFAMVLMIIYLPVILAMLFVLLVQLLELIFNLPFILANFFIFAFRSWNNWLTPGKNIMYKSIILFGIFMTHLIWFNTEYVTHGEED